MTKDPFAAADQEGFLDEDEKPPFFLHGPAFMSAGDSEPKILVPRIAYEGCATMVHGRPRSMKSLATLAGCVELSAGMSWWGLFAPMQPLRVGLLLEEDSAPLVRQRLGWILAGLGLDELPDNFFVRVRSGLVLEAPSARAELLEGIRDESIDILLIDPVRAPFPGVDGGPEKGSPVRRFVSEALEVVRSVTLVHHDVKPPRDGQDARARAERASGGQVLSLADVPIGFTRLGPRAALVEWSLVKIGADGGPVRLDFESGTDHGGGFTDYLRICASEADEGDTEDAAARERVREWVTDHLWHTPTEIAAGTALKRETVDRVLAQLAAAHLLRMETGAAAKARGRHQNAKLWGSFDE